MSAIREWVQLGVSVATLFYVALQCIWLKHKFRELANKHDIFK